jgi:hypothetical protein
MAKLIRIRRWALLAVILYVPAVQAQGTDPAKSDPREHPVAPAAPFIPSGSTNESTVNSSADVRAATDNHPLSGVQELSPSPNLGARNFLVPSISVMSQMSTGSSGSGLSRPGASSYMLGTLDLNRVSERSGILLHYTGGGMVSTYLNAAVQDLAFTYNYNWRRWSLLMGDQASYLSESPFGFGGVGGLAFLNGFGSFLNGSLGPNQTIPTIMVPRFSNTVVSQIEYQLSPRSSWTASGSYGMLNFLGAGFINSTDGEFQTGYNYRTSEQSSIAVIYRFDAFRFTYLPERINGHVVQLGYARAVTGTLSFHIAAGPDIEIIHVATSTANRLSYAVNSGLNYQMERTMLQINYDRLMTGGSGVLAGAQTNQVEATAERKLTPKWRGSASLGYATNQSLIQTAANSGDQQYNSWYAAVRFTHQLRPTTSFYVGYGARLQALNSAACGHSNCGSTSISHEISAGFNFGMRPILFR